MATLTQFLWIVATLYGAGNAAYLTIVAFSDLRLLNHPMAHIPIATTDSTIRKIVVTDRARTYVLHFITLILFLVRGLTIIDTSVPQSPIPMLFIPLGIIVLCLNIGMQTRTRSRIMKRLSAQWDTSIQP